MQVSKAPTQEQLLNTFAPFTDEKRMDRTFSPQSYLPAKNKQELKRDKFEKKYGMLYTSAAVVVGGGILFALGRGGKLFSLKKFIKKLTDTKIANKIKKMTQTEGMEQAKAKTSLFMSFSWGKLRRGVNIMANFNPLKDIGVATLCEKMKLKPVFNKITEFFTKQGKKLTRAKYYKPQQDLAIFRENLSKAINMLEKMDAEKFIKNSKSLKFSKTETIERLRKILTSTDEQMLSIVGKFDSRFDDTVALLNGSAKQRFLDIVKDQKGNKLFSWKLLNQKVDEFGDFIPEKIMEKDKAKIYADLFSSKTILSNNVLDVHKAASKKWDDIFFNDLLKNPDVRKMYYNVKDLLEKFKNPKDSGFASRRDVQAHLLWELRKISKSNAIEKPQANAVKDLIKYIRTNKKGAVEEAVSLCRVLQEADPKLYKTLVNNRNAFQSSFAKAIEFETEKNYGRLLDFSLDAVPSDVISQVASIGGIAWIVADRKKSKEQKVSANLKMGIPLIGGLTVSALCNLRQVASGVNAILLGLITSVILNRIGNVTDKKYQNYVLKKNALNQTV